MFDLSNHQTRGVTFDEVGHTFQSWWPANNAAKWVVVIQASRDGQLVREVEVPIAGSLEHDNPTNELKDVFAVDEAVDHLVGELTPAAEKRR